MHRAARGHTVRDERPIVPPCSSLSASSVVCVLSLVSAPVSPSPHLVVVMVVQPGESNAIDQRILEYTLWKK